MGFFSKLHKLENKVFNNNIVKASDPATYLTNQYIQKEGPKSILGGLWEQTYPKVPEQQGADESAIAAAAKNKNRRDLLKRQGAGPGSTLLTGGEDSALLGSDGTLGNG